MAARVRFHRFRRNPIINLLYNERLKRILKMMNFGADKKPVVLDLGCSEGYFSSVLSLQAMTIGLDIDKRAIVKAQVERGVNKSNKLHFIVADISSLPFRRHSIDVVVCASILEHIKDLGGIVKKIKNVIKKDGMLVAGYPIETDFFKFIWRLVSPKYFKLIDQNQTFFVHPFTHKLECYWEYPSTHKQTYQTIRYMLKRHFRIVRKEKLPFSVLPDSLSYYECIKCTSFRDSRVQCQV